MSFHALVIDNDKGFLEDITDRLESMGHSCDCAAFQEKAKDLLHKNTYSYVLMDLEIPVKEGRRSRIQNGHNVICEIRHTKGYENIPIVIMVSHDKYSSELAIEAMRCNGANDFVCKSSNEKTRTIEKAIVDALRAAKRLHAAAKKRLGKQLSLEPVLPFESGSMVFYPTYVELCGVKVCGDQSTTIRRILDILREKKPNGKYVVYSGSKLARLIDCDGGQNTIATCIMGFRDLVYHTLYHEANIECDRRNDIIINDRKYGYRFSDKIEVLNSSDTQKMPCDPQNDTPNVPQLDTENEGWNERQKWILKKLAAGMPLQNKHIQQEFKVTATTVKRDLSPLRKRGLVVFKGASKTGFWSLV